MIKKKKTSNSKGFKGDRLGDPPGDPQGDRSIIAIIPFICTKKNPSTGEGLQGLSDKFIGCFLLETSHR